jgi:hypothetical protein
MDATFKVSSSPTGAPILQVIAGDNEQQNKLFDRLAANINSSGPGNYKTILEAVSRDYSNDQLSSLISSAELNKLTDFYVSKNVSQPWNASKAGAQPISGQFDPVYYGKQNPEVLERWNSAQSGVNFGGISLPDVDITQLYDQNSYLHQHYTTTGQSSGLRAYAPNPLSEATGYSEKQRKLTDAEKNAIRDSYLAGRERDEEGNLIQEGAGIRQIEAKVGELVNVEEQKKFTGLLQDVLSQTIDKLNKARSQEQTLSLIKGIPGMDEITNLKGNITNSLLGDTGIGGYLNLMGGDAAKKLEKGISGLLGGDSSVKYNWQKWFDETLQDRYQNMTEIADPTDAKKMLAIDKKFAQNFIDNYLRPRFDNSKSMAEFISYMDVKDDEQNVLQTQTTSNYLKQLGNTQARTYINELATKRNTGYFDANFYFNPLKRTLPQKDPKREVYDQQKQRVEADWDRAKNQGNVKRGKLGNKSWNEVAYEYGVDLNNKQQFAQLHYQLVGKDLGFDPASDTPRLADLNRYINSTIIPGLVETSQTLGDSAFLAFTTPAQLAEQLVKSIDPVSTPEEWSETLKRYNIDETGKTVDEIKQLIVETVQTGAAADIRDQIAELNKKGIKPTQEELGYEYIQRDEDEKKSTGAGETALYSLFKSSGYGGTEDEFYSEFMTDTSKEEQALLGGFLDKDSGIKIDTSDPFAALGSIESLDKIFSISDDDTGSAKLSKEQVKSDPALQGMFSSFGSYNIFD